MRAKTSVSPLAQPRPPQSMDAGPLWPYLPLAHANMSSEYKIEAMMMILLEEENWIEMCEFRCWVTELLSVK